MKKFYEETLYALLLMPLYKGKLYRKWFDCKKIWNDL